MGSNKATPVAYVGSGHSRLRARYVEFGTDWEGNVFFLVPWHQQSHALDSQT